MRLAAIDIGSNAVRLLIADVKGDKHGNIAHFRKVKLFRLPVRLGEDAFLRGKISPETVTRLTKAMHIFQGLMEIYEVGDYKACATSAMREAKNGKAVIKAVKQGSGVLIQVIAGKDEAGLILSNQALLTHQLDTRFSHLYVDVGGGSTEVSLINRKGVLASRSFKIGTIRLFKDKVDPREWDKLEEYLLTHIKDHLPLNVIGSGGNINRIFKRSGNLPYEPLMINTLQKERDLFAALEIDDRIALQDINRDRAEVIVPALDIFLFIMAKTEIRQVVVPKIGVADGVARQLFIEIMDKK